MRERTMNDKTLSLWEIIRNDALACYSCLVVPFSLVILLILDRLSVFDFRKYRTIYLITVSFVVIFGFFVKVIISWLLFIRGSRVEGNVLGVEKKMMGIFPIYLVDYSYTFNGESYSGTDILRKSSTTKGEAVVVFCFPGKPSLSIIADFSV
jgi:hypothetical protein